MYLFKYLCFAMFYITKIFYTIFFISILQLNFSAMNQISFGFHIGHWITPGGIRTPDLWLRKPAPCPLGHKGIFSNFQSENQ